MSRAAEDYVKSARDWYQKKKSRPRRLHKSISGLVVVLSVTIPFLASFEGGAYRIAVGVTGVVVAAMTGLSAVYKWDAAWQVFTLAQSELEYSLHLWELKMAEARSSKDRREGLALGRAATKELLDRAYSVRDAETQEFFRGVLRQQS